VKRGDQEAAHASADTFGEALPRADRDARARKHRQSDRGVLVRGELAGEGDDVAGDGGRHGRVEHAPHDLPIVPRPRRPRAQVPADHHLLDVARVHAQRFGSERSGPAARRGHDVLSPDSTNAPMWRNFL
jgi:hypothetical protein